MQGSAAIGGLHEACFGVPDLEQAARYWQAFGFRAGPSGELSAEGAFAAYGVRQALRSVRLTHQDADHGLVRLMRWERPLSRGIGVAPLRAHGSRWVAQFVRSTLDIANHGALLRRSGAPMADVPPSFIDLSAYYPQLFESGAPRPFRDRLPAVREYTLLQPLWRQAFLERFNYGSPLLGRIDESALLPASQLVNASFMIQSDDPRVFDFYAHVLGLKAAQVQEIPYAQATASRAVFELREPETHWACTFEEPRSGATADTRRSGRLYLFRFPCSSALPDRLWQCQPGHLGCTLFTWRVRDLAGFRTACAQAGCSELGPIATDELGTTCMRCVTPDGMTWVFQQASPSELLTLGT